MTNSKRREQQLRDRLAFLNARLGRIEDHFERPPERDDEDRATESEMDEVLDDLGSSGVEEIAAIKAALSRIEDGSYGVCSRCGRAISDARLDLVPQTAFCRDCAPR